jgi:hypothetical protein
MRVNRLHLALMNLNQEISEDVYGYFKPEVALEILKTATGQDFDYDIQQWREWIKKNRSDVLPKEEDAYKT